MNILYPAGVKREWFDRNPLLQVEYFNNTALAPHVSTQRMIYTAPAGRQAYVASIELLMFRLTAAAPAARAGMYLTVYNGAITQEIMHLLDFGNVANVVLSKNQSNIGWIRPGHVLRVIDFDISTGGTYEMTGCWQIVEFDI